MYKNVQKSTTRNPKNSIKTYQKVLKCTKMYINGLKRIKCTKVYKCTKMYYSVQKYNKKY